MEISYWKTEISRENREQKTEKTLISDFRFPYSFPISTNCFPNPDIH